MDEKVMFLDTETTASNPDTAGVFQVSGIIEINGNQVEEFNIFSGIFQDDFVSQDALDKNGYTMKEIGEFQSPLRAFSQFCNMMRRHVDQYSKIDKFIVMAYMADFDNRVLRRWFQQNCNNFFGAWFFHPWIDIMNLAAYILQGERHTMENFKLVTVAKQLGIQVEEEKLHDGLYDVRLARNVYLALTKGE